MRRLGSLIGLLLILSTLTANARTATCQDSGYNEKKFKGQIYIAFQNSRALLEVWYAPEMRHGKPHYQRVEALQESPENKYVRGGFVYTAVLPLNGKAQQVAVTGNTSGSMVTISNDDLSFDLICE